MHENESNQEMKEMLEAFRDQQIRDRIQKIALESKVLGHRSKPKILPNWSRYMAAAAAVILLIAVLIWISDNKQSNFQHLASANLVPDTEMEQLKEILGERAYADARSQLLFSAIKLYESGAYQQAIDSIELYLSGPADTQLANYLQAQALLGTGNQPASKQLLEGIGKDPLRGVLYFRARMYLAFIALEKGNIHDAHKHFGEALDYAGSLQLAEVDKLAVERIKAIMQKLPK